MIKAQRLEHGDLTAVQQEIEGDLPIVRNWPSRVGFSTGNRLHPSYFAKKHADQIDEMGAVVTQTIAVHAEDRLCSADELHQPPGRKASKRLVCPPPQVHLNL